MTILKAVGSFLFRAAVFIVALPRMLAQRATPDRISIRRRDREFRHDRTTIEKRRALIYATQQRLAAARAASTYLPPHLADEMDADEEDLRQADAQASEEYAELLAHGRELQRADSRRRREARKTRMQRTLEGLRDDEPPHAADAKNIEAVVDATSEVVGSAETLYDEVDRVRLGQRHPKVPEA
ncbi:MAG: hypothetical protein ABL886_00960 [Rhodoglobus sp.]